MGRTHLLFASAILLLSMHPFRGEEGGREGWRKGEGGGGGQDGKRGIEKSGGIRNKAKGDGREEMGG